MIIAMTEGKNFINTNDKTFRFLPPNKGVTYYKLLTEEEVKIERDKRIKQYHQEQEQERNERELLKKLKEKYE